MRCDLDSQRRLHFAKRRYFSRLLIFESVRLFHLFLPSLIIVVVGDIVAFVRRRQHFWFSWNVVVKITPDGEIKKKKRSFPLNDINQTTEYVSSIKQPGKKMN